MPRHARIDFPGAVHHVYARGIEKRDVFLDEQDRCELWRRILSNRDKFDSSCLAWAFLPNHFHIVFHSRKGNLPDFMRCYLLEVIRYVHLNPVRARIVSSLNLLSEYPWTGHHEIVRSGIFPWEEFPEVCNFFADGGKTDRIPLYLDFLAAGVDGECAEGRGDGFEAFHSALSTREEDLRTLPEKESRKREFLDIVSRCSKEFGTSPDRIFNKRRDRGSVNARKKILHACVVDRGMEQASVCTWLGLTRAGGAYLLREG